MLLAVRIPLISDPDRFVARLFRVHINFKGAVPCRLVQEPGSDPGGKTIGL
jgi:hypothetical protein